MRRVVGGWGSNGPSRRRARGAPRRAQLRRWICTCTSDPQPRQCRVVRARGGAAGSARSGPPRLSGAPCGRLRRCEPWCLLTPRTCIAEACRRTTTPKSAVAVPVWVGERAAGRAGEARRRYIISGPLSVCPTRAGVAAGAAMRLPHRRGGAPPGTICGWVRSGSARGDQGAERGRVEIAGVRRPFGAAHDSRPRCGRMAAIPGVPRRRPLAWRW